MTRVLLVSPSSAPGGAERALAALARRLPSHGFDPFAVLLQPGPLEGWLVEAGCPVEFIRTGRTRELLGTARTIRQLARRARDASVVVSNQSKGHVFGGLAALAARRPAIWWQQGTPQPSLIEIVAALVPVAAVVASSRDAVQAQRRLTPHRKVELIHLGIDIGAVRTAAGQGSRLRAEHGWEGRTLVGIIGRLEEWKGQEVFLRAAATLARSHRDVVYVVVGGAVLGWEGDYPNRLRHLVKELAIEDRVFFAGHQEDVYPWFDAMDVVVHASFGEPFGLVLVEAMSLGKPVVATAAGGPTEIIEDGVSGRLVPPGDHAAMAAAIAALLNDDDLRKAMATAASRRAEVFSDGAMAQRFGELLRKVGPVPGVAAGDKTAPFEERTVPGLHDFVFERVIRKVPTGRAVDLGANSGAFAARLEAAGFQALAVDLRAEACLASVPFREVDLDSADWSTSLGPSQWDLVTAIEVIEHLEAPISFLRNVASLLTDSGVAVVTTPNVDSLPARAKFLVRGKIRMLDEHGDPTHISPIFWDLLLRQYLPRAGLQLVGSMTFPPDGFIAGRRLYRQALRAAGPALAHRDQLVGDNHVLVLGREGSTGPTSSSTGGA